MEANKNSFGALLGIFNKLSIQQRMLIGIFIVVTIILLGFVMFVFNEPNFSALYTNLAADDAQQAVEHLNAQKIPYKLEDNGQTIRVPKEKVYEVRLALAGKGVPSNGIIGYEIFDKNTMGMSEFMQKLNYKRALEGELARTILQLNEVGEARVHIVFPQKSIFKEEEKEPTASVVLKLKGGRGLPKQNITAITNLISSSVEGLRPQKVTIIDTKGVLLSEEAEENSLAAASSKQYEIKQNVENYLAKKAQSILDNVLGYGNSIVQVNADIDFNQVEKTMELYDPESQVAVSEQTVKSQNSGNISGDSTAQANETTTTNYEISKTIQRVVEGSGNIKRLSIAAVINGIPKQIEKDGKVETTYEPRSDDQLNKLENIIKNAVGVDVNRNDQFSIVSIPFETKTQEMEEEGGSAFTDIDKWMNLILIFIAVGAAMFVMKGLLNKLKNEKIVIGTVGGGGMANDFDLPEIPKLDGGAQQEKSPQVQLGPKRKRGAIQIGDIEDEITDEAAQKLAQQEKISNYVAKNPSEAAKLINTWLHEDEY